MKAQQKKSKTPVIKSLFILVVLLTIKTISLAQCISFASGGTIVYPPGGSVGDNSGFITLPVDIYYYRISESGDFKMQNFNLAVNGVSWNQSSGKQINALSFGNYPLHLSGIVPNTAYCGEKDLITITIYSYPLGQSVCSYTYTVKTPTESISGALSFCIGAQPSSAYSISTNNPIGAQGNFIWTSSNPAWTLTNTGVVTSSTKLVAPNTAGSTILTVSGGNLCQSISQVITALPNSLPEPSVPTFQQNGAQCDYNASVSAISGATSYQWSENNFASIMETTGASKTTDGPFQARQTYNVYVRAVNTCTTGPVRSITKTMPAPAGNCLERLMNMESVSLEQAEVNVFPNPANDVLTIKLQVSQEKTQIKLMDMEGKIIRNTTTTDSELKWQILDVPNGLYIITINSENFNLVKKVQIIK